MAGSTLSFQIFLGKSVTAGAIWQLAQLVLKRISPLDGFSAVLHDSKKQNKIQ
tara:strand:- start:2175 stop:2333 length:159 start_codon:yes stop_codon:yes gene_type:complete